MKKKHILIIFVIIAVIFINISKVHADSFNVTLTPETKNYTRGQTVVVTVSLTGIEASEGIYRVDGNLDYATSAFEVITADGEGHTDSIKSLSGWGNVEYNANTNDFTIKTATPSKASSISIMQISLKVKENAAFDTAPIFIKNLKAYSGSKEITTTTASTSVIISEGGNNIGIIAPSNSTTAPSTDEPILMVTEAPTKTPTKAPTQTPVNITTPTPTPAGNMPQTGIEDNTLPFLIGSIIVAVISFISYQKYKGI